jgi:hypothetical protein
MASIKLTEEQVDKISKLEMSINHWSIEHSKLTVQLRRMVDALDTLYESRRKELDGLLREHGNDPNKVNSAYVDNEGNLVFNIEA